MTSDTTNETAKANRAKADSCPLCGRGNVSTFLRAPDRFHGRQEIYTLMHCSGCACVWLAFPPAPEEMHVHYDEDYHNAIVAGGETSASERWQRHRRRIAQYKQGGAILDVGCSSGAFLGTMKNGAWKLHGIELEASTAEKAKAATGAEVFVGDVLEAPFAPESFEVVTAFDLLEHMYDPRQFLGKVQRWLKPGGIFYTMLPNIDSWESRMFGSYWYGLELPRHLFHFSPASLRHIMNDIGFEEVWLATPPTTYVERSAGYVGTKLVEKLGFSPVPQSKARRPAIPVRVIRKALRMALVQPFGYVAAVANAGGGMEAGFRKK